MNLNIMLIIFCLAGITLFKGTFEAEQNNTVNSSVLNTITSAFLIPDFNCDNTNQTVDPDDDCVTNCSGFSSCLEAVARLIIDIVAAIIFIVVDIFLFVALLIVVLIIPMPDAPLFVQLLFYTIELAGIYVIVGMFRGGE